MARKGHAGDAQTCTQSQGTSSTLQSSQKKEKVKYEMPGQTRATPGLEDPLRRFYESLLKQKPSSEMAESWCLRHGLLSVERARIIAKKTGVVTTSQTSRAKTEVKANATKKPKVADVKKEEKVKPSKGQQQKKKTETKKAKAREDTKRKRVVETKAPAADDSDSEDDMPLAARR